MAGDATDKVPFSVEATVEDENVMSHEASDINHSNRRPSQIYSFQWLKDCTPTLDMGLSAMQQAVKRFPQTENDFKTAIVIYVIDTANEKYPEEVRTAMNIVNPRDWCKCKGCDFMWYKEECFCCRYDEGTCKAQSEEIQRIIDNKYNEYSSVEKTHEVMRQARKATYTQIAIEYFLPSLCPDDSRRNLEPESVVIPSCMKWAVRNRLPDPNKRYAGHGARLSECENNSVCDSLVMTPQHQEDSTIPHILSVTGMSESSASSSKISICSTPSESDEDRNEMAMTLQHKQKLWDSMRQDEMEKLDLPKHIQAVEVLNNQNPELAMNLSKYVCAAIENVCRKYLELEPLFKNIFLLLWCTCGKCCQVPLCKPDECVCCKREQGNCLTNSEEFTSMMKEVQEEYNLKRASARTQEEILLLLEKTRKLIYDRTEDLINKAANEAATRRVAPNCVRSVARATFPNPLNEYNGDHR